MKPVHIRTVAMAAAALVASAANGAAQTRPSDVLNLVEVRQLVERADFPSHGRLSVHFTALAAQYDEDAARHTAMAAASGGNPNRQTGASTAGHCARLAELSAQSADTLRALSRHHERLARGELSIGPSGGARFEQGEGASSPSAAELAILAARARTPGDHRLLAEYFVTLAERHAAAADEHTMMARVYRSHANRRGGDPAVHCDHMVKLSRDAAKEARASAAEHRQFANVG
ncbi:MAG: hypothetical protein A3I61_18775 [Acidobacteria bacterium RIFCSPLOWO2_02_FULL_68_18]|nr:MAG: hypothetical protein A3I61_18775 [Acidobacteria bacterium RIFCSPLOWO2_02_FULL_68_18]OFW48087.1 MAG: hypothetical protein A3G77_11385 [Acidobacteria bacterium RIFCSPLOWO2_12_FULL_68_19]